MWTHLVEVAIMQSPSWNWISSPINLAHLGFASSHGVWFTSATNPAITISLTIQQSPSKQINHFIASIFLTAFHQPCTEGKRYEDTCPGPSLPNPSNFPHSFIALEWHFWTILCPNSPSCYWVGKHDWLGMGYLLYAASEHIYLARDLMRGRHLFLGLGNYWFGHTSFWFQHECSTILLVIVFQRKCLSSLVENLDRQGNLSQLPYHH